MDRRGFLGWFAGVGIAVPPGLPELTRLGETYQWAGWHLRWDGWRKLDASDMVYGFWLARLPARAGAPGTPERHAHWCTNGFGGLHEVGNVFHIGYRPKIGFDYLSGDATDLERDRRQLKTLRYLLAFVEQPEQDPDLLILPDA